MREAISALDTWDGLATAQRVAAAQALAESQQGFRFEGIKVCALGGQAREVAFFRHGGARFALVPGHPSAVLGYDRERPFRPTPAQAGDWADSLQPEFGQTLNDFLDECLSPLRQVTIVPLLVEVEAQRHTFDDFDPDSGGRDGAYRRIELALGLGFRLPTEDEWEYACAAATRTLFRWGDDCPVSNSHAERTWDLHRRPNAFGLVMNHDTYDVELCAGLRVRGGDGGSAVHLGIGKIATWLPLASAFVVPDEVVADWCLEDVLVRRVYSV